MKIVPEEIVSNENRPMENRLKEIAPKIKIENGNRWVKIKIENQNRPQEIKIKIENRLGKIENEMKIAQTKIVSEEKMPKSKIAGRKSGGEEKNQMFAGFLPSMW